MVMWLRGTAARVELPKQRRVEHVELLARVIVVDYEELEAHRLDPRIHDPDGLKATALQSI